MMELRFERGAPRGLSAVLWRAGQRSIRWPGAWSDSSRVGALRADVGALPNAGSSLRFVIAQRKRAPRARLAVLRRRLIAERGGCCDHHYDEPPPHRRGHPVHAAPVRYHRRNIRWIPCKISWRKVPLWNSCGCWPASRLMPAGPTSCSMPRSIVSRGRRLTPPPPAWPEANLNRCRHPAAAAGTSIAAWSAVAQRWLAPAPNVFTSPVYAGKKGNRAMLETIAIILLVLWALGLVTSYSMGGFIHILLVVAVVMLLVRVIQGRRI